MTLAEIEETRRKIYDRADASLFIPSFNALRRIAAQYKLWWAQEELDDLDTRCTQMLRFNMGNVVDEGRAAFIADLKRSLVSLADRVIDSAMMLASGRFDYISMRSYNLPQPPSVAAVETTLSVAGPDATLLPRQEEAIDQAFRNIWLLANPSADDIARWAAWLNNSMIPTPARATMLSALTLRLLRVYQSKPFLLMLDMALHPDGVLCARALVGAILIMLQYPRQISLDKKVTDSLSTLFHNADRKNNIVQAFECLIRTFKTDSITRTIQEDIYPEMLRSSRLLRQMMEEAQPDNPADDQLNPEWVRELDGPLADHMRRFSDMQLNGDDVYMSTFSSMKNYPFFSNIANWFAPFDSHRSDIAPLFAEAKDINIFFDANTSMCHSDKYSLLYTIKQMPVDNIKLMLSQMGASGPEMDDIKEHIATEEWQTQQAARITETELGSYAQDLFRFYRLYPHHTDFSNPLDALKQISANRMSLSLMPVDITRTICAALFDASMWTESYTLFDYLDNENVWDSAFYQQHGYCAEQLARWNEALGAYEKADLVQPGDHWTARHRAACYKKIQRWDDAIACYASILADSPDNVNTIFSLAHCYLATEQYDKARALYFKADFLRPDNRKIRRQLAWCLFLDHRLDEAQKIYLSLNADPDASPADHLNLGHIFVAQKDKPNAIAQYKKALALYPDPDQFIDIFISESTWLDAIGLTPDDIAVLLNQILMQ